MESITKFNLDLQFLYQEPLKRDYIILDNDKELEEWEKKYEKEKNSFKEFVETASLNQLVELILYIFTTKYPDVDRLAFLMGNDYDIDGDIVSIQEFVRKDILGLKYTQEVMRESLPEYDGDMDLVQIYHPFITFQFSMPFSESAVLSAIRGVDYDKTVTDGVTNYQMNDNSVETISLSSEELKIKVNPEKKIYYQIDYLPAD